MKSLSRRLNAIEAKLSDLPCPGCESSHDTGENDLQVKYTTESERSFIFDIVSISDALLCGSVPADHGRWLHLRTRGRCDQCGADLTPSVCFTTEARERWEFIAQRAAERGEKGWYRVSSPDRERRFHVDPPADLLLQWDVEDRLDRERRRLTDYPRLELTSIHRARDLLQAAPQDVVERAFEALRYTPEEREELLASNARELAAMAERRTKSGQFSHRGDLTQSREVTP